MVKYLLDRLVHGIGVLFVAYALSFFILFFLPGEPIDNLLSKGGDAGYVPPELMAELSIRYGFNDPWYIQFGKSLWRLLHGDFGTSMQTGRSVGSMIVDAFPSTLQLVTVAFVIAAVLGFMVAILAWYTSSNWLKEILVSLPVVGASVPVFWSGLVLLQIFSFQLGWVPAMGGRGFISLILPGFALALPSGAAFASVLYRSFENISEQAFVVVAQSKGNSRLRLLRAHILPNAVLPALTVLGLAIGTMLSGSVVTEVVFARPGLGTLTASAVLAKDLQVVQGIVLLSATIYVLANICVDLIGQIIDPRLADG